MQQSLDGPCMRAATYCMSRHLMYIFVYLYEPPRDKTNEMICAPSEDLDQPGYPPSLIRVFAVRSVGVGVGVGCVCVGG